MGELFDIFFNDNCKIAFVVIIKVQRLNLTVASMCLFRTNTALGEPSSQILHARLLRLGLRYEKT